MEGDTEVHVSVVGGGKKRFAMSGKFIGEGSGFGWNLGLSNEVVTGSLVAS